VLSDEEADGNYGADFLVELHPEQFAGVRYAIGEGGGAGVPFAGRKFYLIMVAEKQFCSLRATLRGPAGHGSTPHRGGAMARLASVLAALERRRLPAHITPVTRQMITTISQHLPFPQNILMRGLLQPRLTGALLDRLPDQGRQINPLLHNTVSPTIVRGGDKINVIPGEISLELDGRLLPGFAPDDMLRELGQELAPDIELEVTRFDPGAAFAPDMTHYGRLADILRAADPDGIPAPYMLAGVTDGRFLARLGIQTYGFLPMDLPDGLLDTIHAADERVPVAAMEFGTRAVQAAVQSILSAG